MSPKSALDLHLRNEQKLRQQQAWKKAVIDYANCLDDLHNMYDRNGITTDPDECNEIRREMESLERIWGPQLVGEARSLYNNRLNEQELENRQSRETKFIHRQAQYVARHGETPEQYKNQQKRSSSEPPIDKGQSGQSPGNYFCHDDDDE